MVKGTKAETEGYYRQLVAEQAESGLSIRAFAARRGVPAGTVSAWRHELRRRDAVRAQAEERGAQPGFVRVNVVGAGSMGGARTPLPAPAARQEPSSPGPVVYEVVLAQGRVVRVPAEFDEARVAALVRAVASC